MKKLVNAWLILAFVLSVAHGHGEEPKPEVGWEGNAFNAPARINTHCGWDVWTNFSFIYWQPTEDNIELGQSLNQLSQLIYKPHSVFKPVAFNDEAAFVTMDFEYAPGFKAGMGCNFDYDSWDASAEYTWLRGSAHKFSNGGIFGLFPNVGDDLSIDYIVPSLSTYGNGKASWHLGLDIIDVDLGRSFYSGRQLKFRPFFGLRSGWIDQHLYAIYHLPETNATFETTSTTHSWGIGPRTGFQGNWEMAYGLRLYGNGSLDLLFTNYDLRSRNQVTNPSLSPSKVFFNADQDDLNLSSRTHAEMEFGLGWGSYFHSQRWYFDLSCGYDFQVFFNQNMFRKLIRVNSANGPASISFTPNGNLYIQGLTIKTACNF